MLLVLCSRNGRPNCGTTTNRRAAPTPSHGEPQKPSHVQQREPATATVRGTATSPTGSDAAPTTPATPASAGQQQPSPLYTSSSCRSTTLYVLDCLFSVLVVGTLVVFVWRGAWTILDLYLFPSEHSWSACASLAIGYGIVLLTFSIQTPMKNLCGRIKGIWRIAVVDIYLFFSFCGTVNIWRGFWMLLNLYFLPDRPMVSYWVSHVGSLLLLMLLNCSNSILVRGVYIDGEEEGGKCVVFPVYYLRLFFQTRRLRKLQMIQQEQKQAPVVITKRGSASDAASSGLNHLALAPLMDAPESVV